MKTTRKTATKTKSKLEVLRAPNFNLPWLVHGFSTRGGGGSDVYGKGSLNLGITEHDSRENVERNRALFAQAMGAGDAKSHWPIVQMKQVHSGVVHKVDGPIAEQLTGDGLITNVPELLIGIKTADCIPVLVVDTKKRAVGAFHAGWRGTVARIVEKGIGEMRRHYGSNPRDIQAAIGPAIGKCCYTVGEELIHSFESQFAYAKELFNEEYDFESLHNKYPMLFLNQRAPGHGEPATKIQLDLVEANRRQLLDARVPAANIYAFDACTSCDTKRFFSHRAEFGKTGRMMAAIGIRK
ncbi:peptidoglycan editing factor PgeF [Candidatus Korobacter versatilis]|uniref:peptidoglycan editing factor PgeF n=1 Tax=Candidatus Korobacter versatilis TaxID=658062 RepID=UPI001E2A6AB2|nr:peptidoglycan editing factor PgeF [Candidatus Koribacter versatilis]